MVARANKTSHPADGMMPITFDCVSVVRDFLLQYVEEGNGSTKLRLQEYDSVQNRRILVEDVETCLNLAEKSGEDPWSSFPPEVQSYLNTCFDALDAQEDLPDFPDKVKKEMVKPAPARSLAKTPPRSGGGQKSSARKSKEPVPQVPAPVKKEMAEEEVLEEVKEDQAKNTESEKKPRPIGEIIPGIEVTIEDITYVCLAETISNYILEDVVEGKVLALAKETLEKRPVIRKDPKKPLAGKPTGRKNITHIATEIILENPDMSLAQIIQVIRVEKNLRISEETLRVKYTTIQEVRSWEEKTSLGIA